ncbi:histidine kinase [Nonomuraea rubra]|uniref:histidine kinase n=1 Tax=Nonomuraea rubra TaxID=46180 RepID=UPI0036086F7B
MAVLLLSVGGMFAYHLLAGIFSPAGWIWPVAVAYFTAATTSRVRWVAAVGVAQLGYSAIDAGILLDRNVPRYVIHVAGEGLLLAALIAAGLTYAAAVRRRERVRETDGRARAAEERLRVSHEVHDAIAHTLAIVGVQLNVAADALDEGTRPRRPPRCAWPRTCGTGRWPTSALSSPPCATTRPTPRRSPTWPACTRSSPTPAPPG